MNVLQCEKTWFGASVISYTFVYQPINIKQTQEGTEPRRKADNENTYLSDKHGIFAFHCCDRDNGKNNVGGGGVSHPIGCSPSLREGRLELKAGAQR